MDTVEHWIEYLDLVKSPYNGMTYDCGVTRETGEDPVKVCRMLGERDCINHVHFRNVVVRRPFVDYTEVFLDEGQVDMFGVMKELVRQKYSRGLYPEHPRALDIDRERGIRNQYPGGGGLFTPAISPADPKIMLVGLSKGGCARSLDSGLTWQECASPMGRLIGFHFDRTRPGRAVFAATEQGIWRSEDVCKTWTERTQGLPRKDIQAFAGGSDAGAGVVMLYRAIRSEDIPGAFQGGIYRSRDRGETWEWAMGCCSIPVVWIRRATSAPWIPWRSGKPGVIDMSCVF